MQYASWNMKISMSGGWWWAGGFWLVSGWSKPLENHIDKGNVSCFSRHKTGQKDGPKSRDAKPGRKAGTKSRDKEPGRKDRDEKPGRNKPGRKAGTKSQDKKPGRKAGAKSRDEKPGRKAGTKSQDKEAGRKDRDESRPTKRLVESAAEGSYLKTYIHTIPLLSYLTHTFIPKGCQTLRHKWFQRLQAAKQSGFNTCSCRPPNIAPQVVSAIASRQTKWFQHLQL